MRRRHVLLLVLALAACGGEDDGGGGAADAPGAAGDAAAPTWTSFARGFFETYCFECHGPGDALRDFSLLEMVRAEATTIRAGIESGQFPIGDGPFPTSEERARLIAWIDSGTPE